MGEGVSACSAVREGGSYFERIFEKCGYAGTFVAAQQLAANKEMYIQTLIAYIDKGGACHNLHIRRTSHGSICGI